MPGQITDQRLPLAVAWGGYPGGISIDKGEPLFPRRKLTEN
jgi:methionyl-tRNA synthetase